MREKFYDALDEAGRDVVILELFAFLFIYFGSGIAIILDGLDVIDLEK